jgi:4-hydroxybenzoate polyprenyltransferase
MDFSIYQDFLTYFQNNLIAAIAAVIIVAFLAYKKPKMFFLMLLLVGLVIGTMYIINTVSDIGTDHKKTMIERGVEPRQ